ncbi:MAG: YHS domain-containing protein, partial [Acidobacteriaceae bacterium]|nr:YHS domain-containing protein [Acidobacteriaceae bacterium]
MEVLTNNTESAAECIDPVCGMTIAAEKAAGTVDYSGRTYFFCGRRCMDAFRARPADFVQPRLSSTGSRANQRAAEYTCPMHPEVIRDAPGACPICGMALEPREVTGDEVNPELKTMSLRFWICATLTLPILALMIGEAIPAPPFQHVLGSRASLWFQFALTTPIVLWGGWPFFERAWSSIVNRHWNMFTLIALGTGASYLYSVFALLFSRWIPASFRNMSGELALYFEPAAVITTLVLLGQVLELRARSQTSNALKELLGFAPKTARLLRTDGTEEDIAIDNVTVGDRLRVRPGERVPVDGVVLEGATSIDESMMS